MTEVERARGPSAVAASILVAALVGLYLVASPGSPGVPSPTYLLSAAVLLPAFWFPAMRLRSPRDLLHRLPSLLVWLAAWTLVWDLATAGVVGYRGPLERWWVVYPVGIGFLVALLLLHVLVLRRVDSGPGDAA